MGPWSCLPWEKGIDRVDLGDGAYVVILDAPTPNASWWGVGSWRWFVPGGSNMFQQLVLGFVYPTASLPGETIFEKHRY
jgi:hypothetical protein